MSSPASELSQRLAEHTETVCRHYLFNGARSGGYWIVGDTGNAKGRSLYVRLKGPVSGPGARGKWTDAATGEHGDLLDLIAAREGYSSLADTLAEARRFLRLPHPANENGSATRNASHGYAGQTTVYAKRTWAECLPINGTLAETYLNARSLVLDPACQSLRFHPSLTWRDLKTERRRAFPALVAAVTDLQGDITGIHRTWLDPGGLRKANIPTPRRSLGAIHGHGVWLCLEPSADRLCCASLLIGEGIETVLSLADVVSDIPLVAALAASHLVGFILPPALSHLVIAMDNDTAGRRAARRLAERARARDIEVTILRPALKDFNADRRQLGRDVMAHSVRQQLAEAFPAATR